MGEIKYGLELFREGEDRYIVNLESGRVYKGAVGTTEAEYVGRMNDKALKYLRDGFGLVYDEKKGEWKL